MKISDVTFRKMLKPTFIVFSLILIAFVVDQKALGYTNEFSHEEYLAFQPYTGNSSLLIGPKRILLMEDTANVQPYRRL